METLPISVALKAAPLREIKACSIFKSVLDTKAFIKPTVERGM
ncbi:MULTISPECIES: hypothetical protein [unclassified Sutcliffiella]